MTSNNSSWQVRVAIIAIGIMGSKVESLLLDFLLYPFVIWWLGLIWGGLTMSLFSLFECWLLILFYDWAKNLGAPPEKCKLIYSAIDTRAFCPGVAGAQIKKNLGSILKITPDQIGITYTSGENLTAFGKGQGIQAFTTVLLSGK